MQRQRRIRFIKRSSMRSFISDPLLSVKGGGSLPLKRTRDVAKTMKNGQVFQILGIENQDKINYEMPFRVLSVDFINYARQVTDIEQKNREMFRKASKTGAKEAISAGEYLGRFKKTDRLHPVITLVVYYGEEP